MSKWLHRQAAPQPPSFTRDDFHGKVVLLAFLDEAKPSQRLLPQLNQLHEKWGDKGLVIVRVQEADPSHRATMEEQAKLSPTTVAIVAPGLIAGGHSDAFHTYAVRTTPALFLIDRQGVLRCCDSSRIPSWPDAKNY